MNTRGLQHVARWLSPRRPPRLRVVPELRPEPLARVDFDGH
jgi:hypothetical protein